MLRRMSMGIAAILVAIGAAIATEDAPKHPIASGPTSGQGDLSRGDVRGDSRPQASAPTSTPAVPAFPHDWIGHWSGPCKSRSGDGKGMEFTMELIVGKPDAATGRGKWTIIYAGDSGRQERPYELVVRDAAKGRYAVDEKQGIVIEMTLLDGGLYGQFTVMGNRISVSYRLEGAGKPAERLVVELVTTRVDDEVEFGGGAVPKVTSAVPVSVQRAVMTRRGR